jgi:lipopolysaccharide/colanic/teichoic acid biosynthesis glycosyltransferase/glycosyltransferase involved in cell wall biosynthesis
MQRKLRIGIIGIKAIPARFGGFETAVDEISRGMVRLGHEVVVYNRSGMSWHSGTDYDGVRLVSLPTLRSKNLSTIMHALLATVHVTFNRVDVVHYFTTGTTLFAPVPRLFGMKVVCSVDGTDWQRGKWGRFARWYLRASERLAARFCDGLIADSQAVRRYYLETHRANSFLVTYGMRESKCEGIEWLDRFGLKSREYVLFVGRLVPENNIHHLISAFERTKTDKKLVIVGDDPWEKKYVGLLKATKDPRVVFTGGVYGDGYEQLQRNAYLFALPDEVGGTHPALVEAMGFGNCVLVNDTESNLEVIGHAGFSYRGADADIDLQRQLQFLLDSPELVEKYRAAAQERARSNYSWKKVTREHAAVYRRVLDSNVMAGLAGEVDSSWQNSGIDGDPDPLSRADLSPHWHNPLLLGCKRVLDIFISGMLLILLLPLFLILGVAVKLSSPGPVFYPWQVVGKGGRRFTGFKFRSMYSNADELKKQLESLNEMSGPVFKLTNDPRVTRVGGILRRYSLDELPQLYSVLKGDMSLVGPRPPLVSEYLRFTKYQKQKLAVKPGMTCLWQVKGRNNVRDFDDWVRLDLDYIRRWSLKLDFWILMKTAVEVFAGSGK